ncbi:unnamed protein product [Arctia plantaginis]|uniref:DNA helicase Pif1-like 2B domain-containing protein n=1 Tax=Arctia plantaginis TaxID=874455 RepID=A0A8S0YTT8_ARCPL|nr:unnamed protein product [Arctia plantaginis]
MPRYYTWNASNFQRRKQGDAVPGYPDVRSTDALGRMYTVHPKNDECFYLRSTAADEINACLKSSNLWRYVKKLQLTTNISVALLNDTSAEDFSEQLLTIDELINNVFKDIISNYKNNEWLSERSILAAKNKDVDDLNYIIQNKIIETMHSFKSIDCVTNEDEATNYPIEFLNSFDVPGLPPQNLRLKVGSVVIMLRNINQPKL